jgi:hypothetical protein
MKPPFVKQGNSHQAHGVLGARLVIPDEPYLVPTNEDCFVLVPS